MRQRALALLMAALGVSLLSWPVGAGAAAPDQHGWWTTVPGGPPPDAPSDGLVVEGGPASPLAYAAVVYLIPSGSTLGKLTLTVAANSASVPGAKLELCPLTVPAMKAEQAGPMSDAPAYDCKRNVSAQPASSGGSYQFDATPLVAGGTLAVAILPTAPADRVVLAAPDDRSLDVTSPPAPESDSVGSAGSAAPSAAPESITAPSAAVSTPAPIGTEPLASPLPGSGAVLSAAQPSRPVASTSGTPSAAQYLAGSTTSAHTDALALALVAIGIAGAATGWIFVGRVAVARALGGAP